MGSSQPEPGRGALAWAPHHTRLHATHTNRSAASASAQQLQQLTPDTGYHGFAIQVPPAQHAVVRLASSAGEAVQL
jgi:hypothetical protein